MNSKAQPFTVLLTSRKNAHNEMQAIDLVLLHVVTDHQDWTILTTVEVTLHEAILQEAIHVNVRQEEDMKTMAETMEEGAPLRQEDDWMMDTDMDHHLHDEHRTIMILMIDVDPLLQVAILTHTEVAIRMLDHEVHHRDMVAAVAMADMKMQVIQDDIERVDRHLQFNGAIHA